MNKVDHIKSLLKKEAGIPKERHAAFYKTGVGHYAEHDQFIGVTVPVLRKITKDFLDLSFEDIQNLLESKNNEERLFALLILVHQYQKADNEIQEDVYQFYVHNRHHVNNWNLVDASAHLIIGAHLWKRDRNILIPWAKSEIMWERRIAIVSTWYFIRNNDLEWTFKIASILLKDTHDLIHKAVGWMLREAGKKDEKPLVAFLEQYSSQMPRTMLRYAIERLTTEQKRCFLSIPRALKR